MHVGSGIACVCRCLRRSANGHQIACSCELLCEGIELRSSELLTFEPFPESTGITSVAAMEKSGGW